MSSEESQASGVGPSSGDYQNRPEQSVPLGAIRIKSIEMTEEMKHEVLLTATNAISALGRNCGNLEVARDIAKTFDMKYGPGWNCFVSKDYGASIVHEPNQYIDFSVGATNVLLFRLSD